MGEKKSVKIAIIDMNNGYPNQGMRGIEEILQQFKEESEADVQCRVFDTRQKNEVPDLSFDIYISSGGPGSPFDGEHESWEDSFFKLIDQIEQHNLQNEKKKYMFFICHSFQLACRKFNLGKVVRRKSNAFGIFPVSLTTNGKREVLFQGLKNPFYAVDSRDWQVIEPDMLKFEAKGAVILAIEKERPHVDLERCVMAIRFSKEMIGTQFHPEADPVGMKMYLMSEDKKSEIIKNHGEEKYQDMIYNLTDPGRIMLTQSVILPKFLKNAVASLLPFC